MEAFRKLYPNCKVIASAKEKDLLLNSDLNSSIMFLGEELTVQPDVYVVDGDSLIVGNTNLRFMATPGHTMGGMSIVAEEDGKTVCYSGDTLFKLSIGRTDLYGGDMNVLAKSIKNKLYKLPDDTLVLPGHMGETTIGEEKKYNPYVRD